MYCRLLESDGLRTAVFSGSGQPAGWKATNSRLWLPTMEGVTIVDPADTPLKKKPGLTVIFEKLEADGITHLPHNIPVLPSDTRSVSIYFSVLNFRGFENLKLKYYLVSTGGRVEEAVIDGAQKKLVLRDLEQAGYRFSLSAGNNEKGWSKEPLHFSFSIKYRLPWQEMALFIFIACLAVSIVVALKILDRRNKEKHMMRIFKDDERYKTSGLKAKLVRKHMLQLLTLMEEEKLYLDPELSVTKLARCLGLAKEHISQIINQQFYMNFNQFLNKYRIEEAKKRLKDPKENQYVVLKIAYDVGFNSKSTFNTAFKKFTGMSPSQFREKHQER
jgi:AraC-like DNA-binding protein